MDHAWIDRYAAGADALRLSIAGLTDADLDAVPTPGTWSIREIVLHLADSADRMKRIIAEENPTLVGYDESAFARNLDYRRQEVQPACEIFALNRRMTAAILRRLPDAAFARTGVHTEKGAVTLAGQVQGYVEHLEGHLVHLRKKRELLGKPLPGN
jgi:DinB superfamily